MGWKKPNKEYERECTAWEYALVHRRNPEWSKLKPGATRDPRNCTDHIASFTPKQICMACGEIKPGSVAEAIVVLCTKAGKDFPDAWQRFFPHKPPPSECHPFLVCSECAAKADDKALVESTLKRLLTEDQTLGWNDLTRGSRCPPEEDCSSRVLVRAEAAKS
jgi:hypothetical protein